MAIMILEERLRGVVRQALVYAYDEGSNQGIDDTHLINNGLFYEELISSLVDRVVSECKKD